MEMAANNLKKNIAIYQFSLLFPFINHLKCVIDTTKPSNFIEW